MKKTIFKILLYLFIGFILIIGSMLVYITINKDKIEKIILSQIEKHTTVPIIHSKANIVFLETFPDVSFKLSDLLLYDAWHTNKKQNNTKDTAIYSKTFYLQFNIWNIINADYNLKKIQLENSIINIKSNKYRKINLNFISNDTINKNDTTNFELNINSIEISNSYLNYKDNNLQINCNLNTLLAKGDFAENISIFYIKTKNKINTLIYNKTTYLKNTNTNIESNIKLKDNTININKSNINVNNISFILSGKIINAVNNNHNTFYSLNAQNKNICTLNDIKFLDANIDSICNNYAINGDIDKWEINIAGDSIKNTPLITGNIEIENTKAQYSKQNITLNNAYIKAKFTNNENENTQKWELPIIESAGEINNTTYYVTGKISDFDNWQSDLKVSGKGDLSSIQRIENSLKSISGTTNYELNLHGSLKQPEKLYATGEININNGVVKTIEMPFEASFEKAKFMLNKNNCNISVSELQYGDSEGDTKIEVEHWQQFITKNNKKPKIKIEINSKYCDLDELTATKNTTIESSDTLALFQFSSFFNGSIHYNVEKAIYKKIALDSVKGTLTINNNHLKIKTTGKAFGGTISGEAALLYNSIKRYKIDGYFICETIDIKRFFYEFNDFEQDIISHKNLKGIANLESDFKSVLTNNPDDFTKNINANCDLMISNGELNNYEPLYEISKYIGVEDLSNIEFETLTNYINIQNETITIPEMHIKSNVLDIEIAGKQQLNSEFEYYLDVNLYDILANKFRKNQTEQNNDEFYIVENPNINAVLLKLEVTGNADDFEVKWSKTKQHNNNKNPIKKLFNKNNNTNSQEQEKETKDPFAKDNSIINNNNNNSNNNNKTPFTLEWNDTIR